ARSEVEGASGWERVGAGDHVRQLRRQHAIPRREAEPVHQAIRKAHVEIVPPVQLRAGMATTTNDAVVATHGLTKKYPNGVIAVDGLDLVVRRGEVYGFLGPNRACTTTTLRTLLGLIRPTARTANVAGAAPGTPDSL